MGKHILIIDDSPTIRITVELALKGLGYELDQAGNGIEALEKVKSLEEGGGELALCICDINMPQMDGITFIKEFKKSDKFTPIIVLTTESDEKKIKEGKEIGASGWIVKPFQPDELLNIAKKFLS